MFNSTGAAVGSEFSVNLAIIGEQYYPQVRSLPDGGFVIAWADSSNSPSFQFYDSAGHAVGGQIGLNGDGTNLYDLAVLPSGNIVVVYPTESGEFAGQIISSSGELIGSAFQTNIPNASIVPSIAVLPSGEFFVSWNTPTADIMIGDVHAQRFVSDGTMIGEEFVIAGSGDGEHSPQLAAFGSNDLAAVYLHFDQSANATVDVQLLYSVIEGTYGPDTLTGDDGRDFIFGLGAQTSFSAAEVMICSTAVPARIRLTAEAETTIFTAATAMISSTVEMALT